MPDKKGLRFSLLFPHLIPWICCICHRYLHKKYELSIRPMLYPPDMWKNNGMIPAVVCFVHQMFCLTVVWMWLVIIESNYRSETISICFVSTSFTIFHWSKYSMTRHNNCHILVFPLAMNEKLDPAHNLLQYLRVDNLINCEIFFNSILWNQQW